MHQQDGQVEPVGNLLQHRQGSVVPGVAVAVRLELADFLQGVDDDELGFRVVTQEIGELSFQPAAQQLRVSGDGQVAGFAAGDLHQTALEPLVGVLQAQVYLIGRVFPVQVRPVQEFPVQGKPVQDYPKQDNPRLAFPV